MEYGERGIAILPSSWAPSSWAEWKKKSCWKCPENTGNPNSWYHDKKHMATCKASGIEINRIKKSQCNKQ